MTMQAETAIVSNGHMVLPKHVKPTHYDLVIEPDLEASTFSGKVTIDLDVIEDTRSVTVNVADLTIRETSVHANNVLLTSAPEMQYNTAQQTVTAAFDNVLSAGSKATITYVFEGSLGDSLAGLYRAQYTARNGTKKYLATTLMEPIYARKAFPCFDEPALKATFTVTLIADKGLTCLSNMDVKTEEDVFSQVAKRTKQKVTFNPSPLMSTYLLAVNVGEFDMIENNDFRVPIKIYATPDMDIEHGHFALDLAAHCLKIYEDKFDSKFPLPKMDMVAVPDFLVGAMENWGLVTYRVTALLFDEKTASIAAKKRVAEVVAHELAHQWFGNLVTMDWWEGLWLNEGFATWMSWYVCDKIFPEWKIWESYIPNDYASALDLDSLRSSHPIEVPVKRAEDIEQLFDAISYSKGSCVLRMVSRYLGEETFLEGIRHYLKKHTYANTSTNDLWDALAHVSGKDVEKIMDVWTRKVGFPVVTITEDAAQKTLHLKQNRFLKTADVKPEEDETLYPISLELRDNSGNVSDHVLDSREMTLDMKDMDFYKMNADHTGFFRTSYPAARLLKLGEAGRQGLLTVEDRAGMIADVSALAGAGYQKTSSVLALLQSFKSDNEPVVWEAISDALGDICASWRFEDEHINKALDKYKLDLVGDRAREIDWKISEKDSLPQRQLKKGLLALAGSAGDAQICQSAFTIFEKVAHGGDAQAIHPDLREIMYSIVLRDGGQKEYDAVWDIFKTVKSNTERDLALRALGKTRRPDLIQRTVDILFSQHIRAGESFYPLMGLRRHRAGIEALFAWLKQDWVRIESQLKDTVVLLQRIVSTCTNGFASEARVKEIEQFFAKINTENFDMTLAQSLDAIRSKAGQLERDREDMQAWLAEHGYLNRSEKRSHV